METEVKGKTKFRRLSEADLGNEIPPKFQESDRKVIENLRLNFGYRAEVAMRSKDGMIHGGRHIIPPHLSGTETTPSKRADRFNLEYQEQCSFPVKDRNGNLTERCGCMFPTKATPELIKEFVEVKKKHDRNGAPLYPHCKTPIQYFIQKHCQEEHFDDWVEENGKKEDFGGKTYLRPPSNTTVTVPKWEEEYV